MTATQRPAIDYAWNQPAPQAIAAGGYVAVGRYLSNDPTKNLTAKEAEALAAAGVWVFAVWETTQTRALAGEVAGEQDARAALTQARAAGMPWPRLAWWRRRPIYAACDTDIPDPNSVVPYFRGWHKVLGRWAGAYAGANVMQRLIDLRRIHWRWHAAATSWDHGVLSADDEIVQHAQLVTVGGVTCDSDTVYGNDYGQWQPGRLPPKHRWRHRPRRPLLSPGARGPAVQRLQHLLNVREKPTPPLTEDGVLGPLTLAELERLKRAHGWRPYDTAGRRVWRHLDRKVKK